MEKELSFFTQLFQAQTLLGIVTGLMTAMLLFIGSKFLKHYLIPKLRSLFFEGADLNGTWTVFYTDISSEKPIGFINFIQKGHYVTAELDLIQNQEGKNVCRKYIYDGKFSSGQLVMRFDDADAKGVFMGAVVMHLENDSKTLIGKAVYYKAKEGCVVDTNARMIKGKVTTG